MNTKIINTETLLHLNLEIFLYIHTYFFIYLLFIIYLFIYFYFQSSLCLSNAFSACGWLVHCLSLFISLKLFLFVCFVSSTCLFVFPFSFNFLAFQRLSPFHSKYHQWNYYKLENT
jgi:hypothetical protein